MKPVRDTMPTPGGKRARRVSGRMPRAFMLLAAIALSLLLVTPALFGARPGLESTRALLASAKPWLVALHLLLIARLWLRWVTLIGWANRLLPVPDSFRDALIAARHRAALWLLAVELVVVVGLPSLMGGPHP